MKDTGAYKETSKIPLRTCFEHIQLARHLNFSIQHKSLCEPLKTQAAATTKLRKAGATSELGNMAEPRYGELFEKAPP